MKKFLSKKGTKLGLLIASVAVLVLLLVFCIRPVSVGYTYKADDGATHFNTFTKYTSTYQLGSTEVEKEAYYMVKDGYLIYVSDSKDEYKDNKETIIENWDTIKKLQSTKINAFQIKSGDEVVATCGGAIVTAVVLGVVDLALIGLTVMAFTTKKKK